MEEKYDFSGFENAESAKQLQQGLVGKLIGIGNSMTPILKSRQAVIVEPIKDDTELKKRDIVFCKVNGHYYLHLVHAVKNDNQYLIGNNHGHINGWVSRKSIFGKVIKKL